MRSQLLQGFVLAVVFTAPALCLIGLDTAPLLTIQNTFQCLKSQGYQFANVRAFSLEGVDFDLSVRDTLIYAQKAGLHTDLFIRPCRSKLAKTQIDVVVLVVDEQYYDKFWIYLMPNPNKGCEWHTDYKSNCDYVKTMLNQVKYFQQEAGIYTTSAFYKSIFGNYECDLSEFPLIYQQPNGAPSFQGYEQIGSWKTPFGKMFESGQYACGININKIYQKGDSQISKM